MPSSSKALEDVVAKPRSRRPASKPIANAVITRSSSDTLMPPPPPPKRVKRPSQVLDEDTYTEYLSKIIARDFFPGLAETEAQHEFLDAQASKDPTWIQSAGERLAAAMTPREHGRTGMRLRSEVEEGLVGRVAATPKGWEGDTPRTDTSGNTMNKHSDTSKDVDLNMSLGAFQAKYTSEDNESFNKLLDKQNERRREKYAWMWNRNTIPSARQIAWHHRQEQIEKNKEEQEKQDGGEVLRLEAPDRRKAMPDSWNSRPDNNLMFEPDSVEDSLPTLKQQVENASRAGPKSVIYTNTRMAPDFEVRNISNVPGSPSISAVNDAIAQRPRRTHSEIGDQPGSDTPRVDGYAFVDPEASPEPETQSKYDWSKFSLGPGDAAPNPFEIKEQSNREDLHHRMVERAAKSKRTQEIAAQSKTPVPKFASSPRPGKGCLTPAGQRLLGKVGSRTPVGNTWERLNTPRGKSNLGLGFTPKERK